MKMFLAEDNGGRLWHIWRQHDGRDLAADVTALSDVTLGLGTWQQLASGGWEPTAGDGWEIVDYADIAGVVTTVATWDGTLSVSDPGPYARLALGEQRPTRDEIVEACKATYKSLVALRNKTDPKYTKKQIAANYELWVKYVGDLLTHDEWKEKTVSEREGFLGLSVAFDYQIFAEHIGPEDSIGEFPYDLPDGVPTYNQWKRMTPSERDAMRAAVQEQRPTRDEIAADWELWCEYVDPAGVMTQEAWLAMTHSERVAMQQEVFGDVRS